MKLLSKVKAFPVELLVIFPILFILSFVIDYYISIGDYDTAYVYDKIGSTVMVAGGLVIIYKLSSYLYRGFKYKQW